MSCIGVPELVLALVVIIIMFGATRLPQLGDALGRGIRNFRGASAAERKRDDESGAGTAASEDEDEEEEPDHEG